MTLEDADIGARLDDIGVKLDEIGARDVTPKVGLDDSSFNRQIDEDTVGWRGRSRRSGPPAHRGGTGPGNTSNGPPQPSPKKRNTGEACGDTLLSLPCGCRCCRCSRRSACCCVAAA